jgi:hypothetical protein
MLKTYGLAYIRKHRTCELGLEYANFVFCEFVRICEFLEAGGEAQRSAAPNSHI